MRRERKIFSKDTYEKFENLINYAKEMNKNYPLIVEGMRDEKVLRKMGFEGEIIKINSGMNLVEFSDEISRNYRHVILLLDWDGKGNYLTTKLKTLLQGNSVICNLEIRRKLKNLIGSYITSVEEFSYFEFVTF